MGYIEKTHRKLKNFAKNLAVKTFLRPVKLSSAQIEKAKKISVSSEQINKIGNTTNVVFSINYNGEIFYFRSCRAHVKIKDYVFDLIREFCQLGKQDFLNRVLKLLSSRKHFKKFINTYKSMAVIKCYFILLTLKKKDGRLADPCLSSCNFASCLLEQKTKK